MVREFRAHELIPNAVSLRPRMAENWKFFMRTPLHELVGQTPTGTRHVQIGMTFHLDQIIEAHLRRIRTGKRASIQDFFLQPSRLLGT
jgi:hypothetical protein